MSNLSSSWKVIAASIALALGGCASSGTSASKPEKAESKTVAAPAAAPAAAAAPAKSAPAAGAGPSIQASAGSGTVVFFRESKFMGAAVSFKVREGEQELGKLGSGNYFVVNVPPGAHAYTVHSEAKDVLNLEVEAGETYYVQGSISMGVMVGRPNLAPSDAATFEGMKAKLKDSGAPKTAKRK